VRSGAGKKDIALVRVPGAFEVPIAARALAETKKYDAIVCIGCLLRGDTAHYDVEVHTRDGLLSQPRAMAAAPSRPFRFEVR